MLPRQRSEHAPQERLTRTAPRHLEGRPRVEAVNQEHGFVRSAALARSAQVGDRVRVLPNHACMTAAAYEAYAVVDGPRPEVVARWSRVNGF